MSFLDAVTRSLHRSPRLKKHQSVLSELVNGDGVTHIRVDNRGQTAVGRELDSQTIAPFVHPYLGQFNTTEGFWFYISMQEPDEQLRMLSGHECRKYIKQLRSQDKFNRVTVENFYEHICNATWLKVISSPELLEMVRVSSLPFRLYYIKDDGSVVERVNGQIGQSALETVRNDLKFYHGATPPMDSLPYKVKDESYLDILSRISDEGIQAQGLTRNPFHLA